LALVLDKCLQQCSRDATSDVPSRLSLAFRRSKRLLIDLDKKSWSCFWNIWLQACGLHSRDKKFRSWSTLALKVLKTYFILYQMKFYVHVCEMYTG